MGKVITVIAMSLDGFIAGPNEDVQHLLKWYFAGEVEIPIMKGRYVWKLSPQSAKVLQETMATTGAMVCGRHVFDMAGAWEGDPPFEPCFVVTHHPPQEWLEKESPFTFVTDGVDSAVRQAKQAAGNKNVVIATPNISQQAMKLGLVDEIQISLVPVLLGSGVPLFAHLGIEPVHLEAIRVVEAPGITHLGYKILK